MWGNAEALKLLFPIPLGSEFEQALEADAVSLDAAQASADQLLVELFPDGAHALLTDWEHTCGVILGDGVPLQSRREQIIRKLRELGDIKAPAFVTLTASLGYEITIEHLTPFMAGWGQAGELLGVEDSWWVWLITIKNKPVYGFRAGVSAAGEYLGWTWDASPLEQLFNDLKPADVHLIYIYP